MYPTGAGAHLKELGISKLEGHLIWIPPCQFTEIEYLGQGGFAKVYRGTTKWHTFAMKELDRSMLPEVVWTGTPSSYHLRDINHVYDLFTSWY